MHCLVPCAVSSTQPPRGLWVERIDPLRFSDKKQLNLALSALSLSVGFPSVFCAVNQSHLIVFICVRSLS